MPTYHILICQSCTDLFIYFCKLCFVLRLINEICDNDALDSLSLMQVTHFPSELISVFAY